MPKRIIKTDVTDWDDDFEAKKPDVITEDEIIKRRKEGMHSAEAGRHRLIAELRGLSDANIVGPSKSLIQLGVIIQMNRIAARKKRVELANGSNVDIREFVSPVLDENEDENEDYEQDVAIVDSSTVKGTKEAVAYLLKIVPGYVYGRLAIIAKYGNEGDAQRYANELKSKIDEIMVKLG